MILLCLFPYMCKITWWKELHCSGRWTIYHTAFLAPEQRCCMYKDSLCSTASNGRKLVTVSINKRLVKIHKGVFIPENTISQTPTGKGIWDVLLRAKSKVKSLIMVQEKELSGREIGRMTYFSLLPFCTFWILDHGMYTLNVNKQTCKVLLLC